jgi:hypothetical protein
MFVTRANASSWRVNATDHNDSCPSQGRGTLSGGFEALCVRTILPTLRLRIEAVRQVCMAAQVFQGQHEGIEEPTMPMKQKSIMTGSVLVLAGLRRTLMFSLPVQP